MKTLYCTTITSRALQLIRSYEGDVNGCEAVPSPYYSPISPSPHYHRDENITVVEYTSVT
jgi:hypothetical protein